jgi:hypothetical protein
MSKFYAQTVHSDILIHWTGRDFDPLIKDTYHNNPNRDVPSKTDDSLNKKYVERLFDILCYGIWVKEDKDDDYIVVNGNKFTLPKHPRTCFTELKLSESRKHAFKFGRLGIGFKRLFVVMRGGQPVNYLHNMGASLFFPPHIDVSGLSESRYCFFKSMNSNPSDLNYDLFAESEWRIVYDRKLSPAKYFVDPRSDLKGEFGKYAFNKYLDFGKYEAFCRKAQADPDLKFLLPLDGWLAMIIYPSPDAKNMAESLGVQKLIQNIKKDNPSRVNPEYEQIMMPLELDLDLCDHF